MKKVTILVLLFIIKICYAQEAKSIQYHVNKIKIDGKLDESIWNKIKPFSGFYNYYPNDEGKAINKTVVKMFHDRNYLYIGAIYYDTTSENKISSLKRDGQGNIVVFSDAFGIVLDPFNTKNNGYFLAVNAGNSQFDALVNFNGTRYRYNESWDAIWKSETSTVGNKKIYEIAIPFKAFSYDVNRPTWGIQFFVRDFKKNIWMTLTDMSRDYIHYDLRFTENIKIEQLPEKNESRFTVTPSITYNYHQDVKANTKKSTFKHSLDAQYSITSSLRLGATINPDFSQIDVDKQITNLTRFNVSFPERRNFFLEDSDLFTNLGSDGVNPFYSRRIGSKSDIQFGLKLSGNITENSRIGFLDVQTEKDDNAKSQNYSATVFQQKIFQQFTATGYLINRQETTSFKWLSDYNRVAGLNLNYRSKNKKWTGVMNYGKSFTSTISDKTSYYSLNTSYNKREVTASFSINNVDKNYITDVGFVPRLTNYDALNDAVVREGYMNVNGKLSLTKFFKDSNIFDSYRYLRLNNSNYWDESGKLSESYTFFNNALWFKDLSSIYINIYHNYINLKYDFDPLRNGNSIIPDVYNFMATQLGYKSVNNTSFYYDTAVRYGTYYNGHRLSSFNSFGYRLLPYANLSLEYQMNTIDLKKLGEKTFHLAQITGEIFFSNKLSWTNYVQYNTQKNNFNVNSRLQWEYKPLSYLYLVVTDNYNKTIYRTNWGVAFKMNYRFDF